MAKPRIDPDEAFEFYKSLGPTRTLSAVAQHFSVTTRTIETYSASHGWSQKLAEGGIDNPYGELAQKYGISILEELLKTIHSGEMTIRNAGDAVKLGEFVMKLVDKGVRPAEQRSIQKTLEGWREKFAG